MLPGSGSGVSLATVAVLSIGAVRPGSTRTRISKLARAPTASTGASQVMVPELSLQPWLAERYSTPAGSLSVTFTALACEGPALWTLSV